MKTIKLIITDIDGVWTDGGMYYSDDGSEFRKFNTSDSVGVLLLKESEKELAIISGEKSESVSRRAKKLKIESVYLGIKNKLELVTKLCEERSITLDEVAFIGDEINDHPLLKKVGYSGCPISAPQYTKNLVNFIVPTKGGFGAFRDFVIQILKREELLDQTMRRITD